MIQFNLLPDVKKEYVKAKRTKRLIMMVSFVASSAMLAVLFLLFSYAQFGQKKHINDLTEDIKNVAAEVQATPDLNRVLSVQNQLRNLPSLHTQKPHTSRLFDYIEFVSPKGIALNELTFDGTTSQITMSGTADSIATINKLADNIKAVTFTVGVEAEQEGVAPGKPFTQISTQLNGENDAASFEIFMQYDPAIFDNTQNVTFQLASEKLSVRKK